MKKSILKYLIGAILLNSATAFCEYDIQREFNEAGNVTA